MWHTTLPWGYSSRKKNCNGLSSTWCKWLRNFKVSKYCNFCEHKLHYCNPQSCHKNNFAKPLRLLMFAAQCIKRVQRQWWCMTTFVLWSNYIYVYYVWKLYKQRVGTNIAHIFHPYEWVHLPCASPIYKIFSNVSRKSDVRICMLWINFKNIEPHNDRDHDKLMIIIDKL